MLCQSFTDFPVNIQWILIILSFATAVLAGKEPVSSRTESECMPPHCCQPKLSATTVCNSCQPKLSAPTVCSNCLLQYACCSEALFISVTGEVFYLQFYKVFQVSALLTSAQHLMHKYSLPIAGTSTACSLALSGAKFYRISISVQVMHKQVQDYCTQYPWPWP